MADVNDARLEQLLRATLRAETAVLPVVVQPGDVLLRRQERRIAARRRLPFRVLAIAAAVALPLAAILGVGLSDHEPAAGQGAVIVRGLELDEATNRISDLEVILVDDTGREHGLVRYDAARFELPRPYWESVRAPAGSTPPTLAGPDSPKVSQDGWLAFSAYATGDGPDERTVLVDLTDPRREPILLEGTGWTAWGPDGSLWRYTGDRLERIEPETDRRESSPGSFAYPTWYLSGGLAVSADGSGVITVAGTDMLGEGPPWYVKSIDGDASVSQDPPTVAAGMGPRRLSPEHGRLKICDSDPDSGWFCPDLPRGTIISQSHLDRPFRTWGSPPGLNRSVLAASWAADGGVWRVDDRRDEGRLIDLVHVSPSGGERTAVTISAGLADDLWIAALDSDDSTIALGSFTDRARTLLADTPTGVTRRYDGQMAGFVSAHDAIDWLPGSFDVPPGAVVPATPRDGVRSYSALPPVEHQLPDAMPADSVLLLHEEAATIDEPGTELQTMLGPIHVESGYGTSLVCSGPGDATHQVLTDPPSDLAVTHCEDVHGRGELWTSEWEGDLSIKVIADAATDWRLVVFDPPADR